MKEWKKTTLHLLCIFCWCRVVFLRSFIFLYFFSGPSLLEMRFCSSLSHEGEDVQLLKRNPSQGEHYFIPATFPYFIYTVGRDYLNWIFTELFFALVCIVLWLHMKALATWLVLVLQDTDYSGHMVQRVTHQSHMLCQYPCHTVQSATAIHGQLYPLNPSQVQHTVHNGLPQPTQCLLANGSVTVSTKLVKMTPGWIF